MSQKGRILREQLGHNLGILQIAQNLHCVKTGTLGELDSSTVQQYLAILVTTLADWELSQNDFEKAVKLLCEAAVIDAQVWLHDLSKVDPYATYCPLEDPGNLECSLPCGDSQAECDLISNCKAQRARTGLCCLLKPA